MMYGVPPFYNKENDVDKMYADIAYKDINFPSKVVISDDGKDFIKNVSLIRPIYIKRS